ncbi:SRPBCC family protein [Microbacterium sp. M28]|uniref:SRPBCC family protein n=1 Tax=Microbacterium sp. M28 TaxID=2962064 RepID=UPI0021F3FF1D|nr:SRPBCC family protein [Microbacterium sp. M28]UYO97698.1 SRPBCC family protein [Microbacterium sp. M28]
MTEVIRADIEVEAPARAVYDQWARLEDMPHYMSMVKSIERLSENRTHWVVNVGGVEREFDAVVTEAVPNQRIAWASDGEKVHTGVVRFIPVDAERTRVELEMGWVPETLTEKAGALLNLDERAAASDLRRFKELMEGGGGEARVGADPDLAI